ncbi:hypothetical protein [Gracilibacillus xinjiangensis]|uniref:Uncharacterized protein n=1 Tax=Gracilibacillus xinjiangensis TaxID=1193282 RepID=A0ABV8WR34_9BACI
MNRKTILWVIDPFDPIISHNQIVSLSQSHYKENNQIYIQLLEYHSLVYRQLSNIGKMLPPFSWNNEVKQGRKKGFYQFLSYSIPKNIRLATYNYPALVKIYWQHMKSRIIKDDRFYDEVVIFSQGLPQYYVKERIAAKKIIVYHHLFQPESVEFLKQKVILI